MKPRYYLWLALTLALTIAFGLWCNAAQADIRVNLLAKLNRAFSDASNVRLSEAQKIMILDDVGEDVGGEWVYSRLDTVTTVADQEHYSLNADCAGGIKQAYILLDNERQWLQIVGGNELFAADKGEDGSRVVVYGYMVGDQTLAFERIPPAAHTIVLEYYAYPAALSGDSTEWDLPEKYERAALDIAAAMCFYTVETAAAERKADKLYAQGLARIRELKNPSTASKTAGETPR